MESMPSNKHDLILKPQTALSIAPKPERDYKEEEKRRQRRIKLTWNSTGTIQNMKFLANLTSVRVKAYHSELDGAN